MILLAPASGLVTTFAAGLLCPSPGL